MAASRFRTGEIVIRMVRRAVFATAFAASAAVAIAWAPGLARAGKPLVDEPIQWYAEDRGNIEKPLVRDPSLTRNGFDATFVEPIGRFFNPVRVARHVGGIWGAEVVHSAGDINALDEAYNSTWFTNRIGVRPMTPQEVARGAITSDGPDMSAPWKVVKAKTAGVTSGFNIKDAKGTTYVLKFDPPGYIGSTTGAGVVAGRLLWAAGYNVSQDFVVEFKRDQVEVGDKVQIAIAGGKKRTMTKADLDTILSRVAPYPDGRYRAIASQFLPGEILGPYRWKGYKKSDPFDRVKHENRRTLRGLRMICAWLAHFDVKELNTMDVYLKEGGHRYVKHYLFDFTATLGTGGTGPSGMQNFEYGVDFSAIAGRMIGLGIPEDAWRRIQLPPGSDPELGYYEAHYFDPMEWKPLEPNASFANLTSRDGYWAAKIVSAFRREHMEAALAEGNYHDPKTVPYLVQAMEARRDKIARYWFDRVPPLDFFTWEGGRLAFHDLGAERGLYPGSTPRYRVRTAPCNSERGTGPWSEWTTLESPSASIARAGIAAPGHEAMPFIAAEVAVDRGHGFSRSITVYLSPSSGRVIGLDR